MGSEQTAQWYDAAWQSARYQKPAAELPHRPLWEWVAERVDEEEFVIDLGCGLGHLCETVGEREGTYLGMDFSEVAVAGARDRCGWAWFDVADIRTAELPEADVYVACEVLEHVEDDLGILRRIPAGKRVLLTLPTFDDTGHVRWFDSLQDVALRYAELLEFVELDELGPWFVVEGVRCE